MKDEGTAVGLHFILHPFKHAARGTASPFGVAVPLAFGENLAPVPRRCLLHGTDSVVPPQRARAATVTASGFCPLPARDSMVTRVRRD